MAEPHTPLPTALSALSFLQEGPFLWWEQRHPEPAQPRQSWLLSTLPTLWLLSSSVSNQVAPEGSELQSKKKLKKL